MDDRTKSGTRPSVVLAASLVLLPLAEPNASFHPPSATEPAPAVKAAPETLEILAFNTFLRPSPLGWIDAGACRGGLIGRQLRRSLPDIAVLTETFEARDVGRLTDALGAELSYRVMSEPASPYGARTSGGVSLLSRFPMEAVQTHAFSTCAGSDCLASKGFVYALVRIAPDAAVHVLGTHLDAGRDEDDVAARAQQLAELSSFAASLSPEWPVVLAGDLNVDGLRGGAEHASLRRVLGGFDDAYAQVAAGRDERSGNTLNCRGTVWCGGEWSPNDEAASDSRMRLDYVLLRAGRRAAVSPQTAEHLEYAEPGCGASYLSDHKAVRTTLRWQRRS